MRQTHIVTRSVRPWMGSKMSMVSPRRWGRLELHLRRGLPEREPARLDRHAYNLFRYLCGVPKFVVCDNLKAAVTNPDRFDPGLNRTYAEMASHYGTAILAARPRRPKDKAKVEVAVQIAQRWILARLRNQRFLSLAELNAAIRVLVVELNARNAHGVRA